MFSHTFLTIHFKINKLTGAALYGIMAGAILPPCLMMVEIILYSVFCFEKQSAPAALDIAANHPHQFILMAIFFAPLFETFIFQFLILGAAKSILKNSRIAITTTAMLFSLAHVSEENFRQAITALFSGLYFTYIYMQVASTSRLSAFIATVISHATHNTIVCILSYYLMWYQPNGISL